MSREVSAEEIAQVLGMSERSVQRRAEADTWLFITKTVRGGRKRLYPALTLPLDVREPVEAWIAQDEADQAAQAAAAEAARLKLRVELDKRADLAARQHGMARYMTLPEPARRRADARAALADIAGRYWRACGQAKKLAFDAWAARYSAGDVEVPAWIRDEVPSCCGNSLMGWGKKDLASLAGRYGLHRKGKGVIDSDADLRKLVVAMLVEHPDCSAKHVMRAIRARFENERHRHPNFRTLQRFMATWRADHEQELEKIRNPDGWRSKYQAASGSRSEAIVRLNQLWEMDSTKGDVLLSDGRRHTIVQVIDVYSRRMKLQVSRTSSTAAVASTLRAAILDWGIVERLRTDQGADYISEMALRVYAGLGIEHDPAPPYEPQEKPHVERGFGTFCRDVLALLPGFIGHSVADRKAIENRKSFAQRMATKGETVEIRLSPEEFQDFCDRWADTIYGRDPHSGMDGKSPFEVAAAWREPVRRIVDERALDVLLAPAAGGDGTRVVTKKGLHIGGVHFDAPELGGLEGKQVRVLLDDRDAGRVWVFLVDGAFVCEAICPELADVSRADLAAARKARQKRIIDESVKAAKAEAKAVDVRDIAREILDSAQRASAQVVPMRQAAIPYTTQALDEAGKAARASDGPTMAEILAAAPPAEPARVIDLAPRFQADRDAREAAEKAARIERWLRIDAAITAGEDVTDKDRKWHGNYGRDPELVTHLRMERMRREGTVA